MTLQPAKRHHRAVFLFAAATLVILAPSVFAQSFLAAYQKGSGEFELEYTIGGDIEDEDCFLARPIDLALDATGSLFVLDMGNCCIKKFDPAGRFLQTFGREGDGPGEMAAPIAIETYPDGRVFLCDQGNRRFTLYDAAGTCLATRDLTGFGWRVVSQARVDRAGRLYVSSIKTDFASFEPMNRTIVSRVHWESMTETVIDSAAFRQTVVRTTDRGRMTVSAPYHPGLFWGVGKDGDVVVANSSDYSIKIYSPELAIRRTVTHPATRRPVTKADKEDYFSAFKNEEVASWMRRSLDFPKYQPYFDRLIIDSDGYLLFLVDATDDAHVFDVFTPEVEFVNRVTLPRTHLNAIFSGGRIYTIAGRGEQDPVVRRYRLK